MELHNLLFCYQRYHLHLVHRSVWAGVSSPGRAMCLPCRSSYSGTSKCPSGAVWLGDSRTLLGCTSESGLMLALQHCSHSASAVLAELTGLMMPLGILVLGLGTWSPASGIAFSRHTSCPVSEPFLFPVCSRVLPGSISWPLYITGTQRAI